jgi:basic membrane protein A and related proteins
MSSRIFTARRRGGLLLSVLVIAGAGVLAATATGRSHNARPNSSSVNPSSLRIGVALAGARNDRSFYQAHYDGALAAQKKLHFKLSVVDNLESPQAQLDGIRNLAQAGNNVVVGAGGFFYQGADALAVQFPKTHFIVTEGNPVKFHKNVTSISPDEGVPSFVAGVVMAKLSKTGVISVVGGLEIPPTVHNSVGVRAGAKWANPKIKVINTVVGTFNDPAKAKSAASAQIASKSDTIFAFLDSGFPGAIDAAKQSGKTIYLLGPIAPRCDLYSRYVGTTIQRIDLLVQQAIQQYAKGTLKPGAVFYGLENRTVQRFELCPKFRTPRLLAAVKSAEQALLQHKVKLPAAALNARPSYYKGP